MLEGGVVENGAVGALAAAQVRLHGGGGAFFILGAERLVDSGVFGDGLLHAGGHGDIDPARAQHLQAHVPRDLRHAPVAAQGDDSRVKISVAPVVFQLCDG